MLIQGVRDFYHEAKILLSSLVCDADGSCSNHT